MALRYFLPIYLVVYEVMVFVWRSYVVRKRTGINPIVFTRADSVHGFIGRVFKVLFPVVVLVVLVYSFLPGVYAYLAPISWLEQPWLRSIGVGLLIASLLWTVLAQARMGESWRIGIDAARKTKLVEGGVYGVSRNPIFVGIIATQLGLLLVIPNALTLLNFVLGVVLINIQVRLEEEYLRTMHGEDYVAYTRRVRRWI